VTRIIKAVSLFSGGGGLDLGMEAVGIRVAAASDLEEYACSTIRQNFPHTLVIGPPSHDGDIKNHAPAKFLRLAGLHVSDLDVVVGGPPCQPFSIASNQRFLKQDARFKRRGFADEIKGGLIEQFLHFVAATKPTCFIMENVPGILEIDNGRALGNLLDIVASSGYKISPPAILDSVNFGIPQRRRRCFILGTRRQTPPLLPKASSEIPGMPNVPRTSVAHALLGISPRCPNHVCRNHEIASIERYKKLAFGERELLGRVDRLDPTAPSKTIISGGSNGGGRSHLHPFIARTLSVRESARLQTFPDNYAFSGSIARQFTQVGNAVPPFLAAQIFFFILTQVFRIKSAPPAPPSYLKRDETTEELSRALWRESKRTASEWLYEDSVDSCPTLQNSFSENLFVNA